MASRRKKKKSRRGPQGRRGHELEVKWSGYTLIAGPKERERELREKLEQRILRWLVKACPKRFGSINNPLPGNLAFEIAWDKTEFREASNEIVTVRKLYVHYRNRRNWRQWIRVEKDKDLGHPGRPAT